MKNSYNKIAQKLNDKFDLELLTILRSDLKIMNQKFVEKVTANFDSTLIDLLKEDIANLRGNNTNKLAQAS